MRRYSIGGIVLALLISPFFAHAASSIGFLESNLWSSPSTFFAGDSIRLYTAISNGGTDDVVGTVEFFDNGNSIGTAQFAAVAGSIQAAWHDWTAVKGQHAFSATIISAFSSKSGKAQVAIALTHAQSSSLERFVDSDNDEDGIGDATDADDDNDGVSDVDEVAQGTNPLKADVKKSATASSEGSHLTTQEKLSAAAASLGASTTLQGAIDATAAVTDTVDGFADNMRTPLADLQKKIEADIAAHAEKESNLPAGSKNSVTDLVKRFGLQIYRYVVIAALFIIDHKWLLYFLLAFVLYKLVRFLLRRVFPRRIQ